MIKKALKTTYLGLTSLLFISTPIVLVSNISINKNYQPTTSINKLASSDGLKLETLDDLNNANPSEVAKLSSYDGRSLGLTTPIKTQDSNISWTYSTAAAIEANILKNKLIPSLTNTSLNINENNIDYITNWRQANADPLGLTYKDTISKGLKQSGYTFNAANALMQWNGPIESSKDASTLHDPLLITKNVFYMQDYNLNKEKNPSQLINKIKEIIVQYGAIGFEYNTNNDIKKVKHYNVTESNIGAASHSSTIIGWDDNISKDLYSPASKYDGGWIVKNSYGTEANDGGYFYMSYDSVIRGLCAYEMVKKDTYQNNYYYDGLNDTPYSASILSIYKNKELGVIFPAKKASDSITEKLSAINVGIKGTNVTVKVQVYTNVNANLNNRTAKINNPSSGTLKAEVTQTFSNAGLYTIDLKEPVTLNKGEKFGVVVSITSDDNDAAVLLSKEPKSTNDMTYRKEDGEWISTSIKNNDQYYQGNLVPRIKAFTTTETISTPEPDNPTTPEPTPPTTEPEEPTNPSPSPEDEEIKSDVVISKQPETTQEVPIDKSNGLDLSIDAKSNQGKQLKYQWYENKGDGWKSIEGATNSTYNIPSTELQSVKTETTWQYRAEIQYNDGTNAKLTSQTYNVKVKPTTSSDDNIADDTTTKTSRYLSIPAIVGIAIGGVSVSTIIGSSIYFAKKKKK